MKVNNVLKKVNRRKLTTNAQKVAYRLLTANGGWVSNRQLNQVANSATSRARDLRKEPYGSFTVQCKSASEINKRGTAWDFYYRISPNKVTLRQLETIFGLS